MFHVFPDTNVLIECLKLKIDLQEELIRVLPQLHQILMHCHVKNELMQHAQGSGQCKQWAAIALKVWATMEVFESSENHGTDTALTALPLEIKPIVLTFDGNLRRRCKLVGIPTITLKTPGKFYLEAALS